ncbi:MAG: insulinase family protein [Candidatus Hydrogenedentes bacterium]|nr:insulinase family protein [Candidatus Hydrogenedentota bacterium]
MKRFCCAGLVVLAVIALVLPFASAEQLFDFHESTLDNGMRVVTLEDFSTPIVAVQVWYDVGSKDEDPERQGFAHMFEHMMFAGTERIGSEQHGALLREIGGDCNAFTSFDFTAYVNTVPANQLELVLWLEAERLMYLDVSQESFDTERQVVEEERRMGINQPYGTIAEQVLPAIFKEHPYRWMPIGNIPDLRAAHLSELQRFWDRFYLPSNATLVIVGAVKHKDAQELAKKYFGWMPGGDVRDRGDANEPPQNESRSVALEEPFGPVPLAGYIYRGVPESHEDAIPLQLLMMVLGEGESSRLYTDLVRDRKLCVQVMADAYLMDDDGVFGAGAALNPMADIDKALEAIDAHLQAVIDTPVDERELTKAKNQMLRTAVTDALTVESKAQETGYASVIYSDPEWLNKKLDTIRAVALDDLQRVAKTYITPKRQTVLRVTPNPEKKIDEDETAPVAPPETEKVERKGPKVGVEHPDWFPMKPPVASMIDELPEIEKAAHTLENGLKVVVVPNHEVPFVTVTLGSTYGAWAEDPATPGVAAMTYSMLTQGTENYTAAELAETIEFNAITLSGVASLDEAQVTATGLTDKLPLAVELLAEVVRRATFPGDQLDLKKEQLALSKSVDEEDAQYIASRGLRQAIFGEHPYSRAPEGELADVPKLNAEALRAFWKNYLRPDTAVIYLAGDVKEKQAYSLVEKYFGDWTAQGEAPSPGMAPIPEAKPTHIVLIDRPGAVQSQIAAGQVSITRNDPRYHASRVYSQIFGGAFESRLNTTIRIERGLTYGAFGGIRPFRYAGQFFGQTFTKTESTVETVQALLDVINGMKSNPPTSEELTTAKAYLAGSFPGQLETPQDTVSYEWIIEYMDLPANYLNEALEGYKSTTLEDALGIASEVVDAEALTIVVVGEAGAIREKLEAIAPVTVIAAPEAPAEAPAEEGSAA